MVNDLGGDRHGGGKGGEMADTVVEEIKKAGGDAVANYDSVATREGADGMLWSALNKFGKVDILVNNAGVLRDKSFLNMSDTDWNLVFDVHMKGTYYCSQAVCASAQGAGQGRAHHQHHVGARASSATSARPTTRRRRPASTASRARSRWRWRKRQGDGQRDRAGRVHAHDRGSDDAAGDAQREGDAGARSHRAGGALPGARSVGGHHRHDRRRAGHEGFGLQDDRDCGNDAEGQRLDARRSCASAGARSRSSARLSR